MSFHPDDMAQVQAFGEVLPEEWFHVRFAKVEEKLSKESNEPTVYFNLKVQEEPFVGRVIPDNASLQPHALAKLKAYYEATNKGIVDGGHDPELLLDGECYVKVTHTVNKTGEGKRMSVAPYNIKPLSDGKPTS